MKKYLTIFFSIISVIIAVVGVYYQAFYKERTALNIERVTSTLLTRPLKNYGKQHLL